MSTSKRFQILILILTDLLLFYISLYLALVLRYRDLMTQEIWHEHQLPFLYIHIIWLVIFYIGGLYDIKSFASFKNVFGKILKSMIAASVAAVLVFYLLPEFGITPKTNLSLDIIILLVLLVLWRRLFWDITGKFSKIRILFFGESEEVTQLVNKLRQNPRSGYEPAIILKSVDRNLSELIKQNAIQLIVASKSIMRDKNAARKLYEALPMGVSVVDFESFYESLSEKIPVYLINELWFLENMIEINKKIFEKTKRAFDISGAILLGIPTLIIMPLLALMIKAGGKGPIFYKHNRVGKNGKIFEMIKFRTMIDNAEKNGAEWTKEKDSRIMKTGYFLRKTRLDELPQLWNILKGEMSFIGPRPERPEFIITLEKEIPHYAMRHLVRPGLSGWAQIKFPYGASVEDAMEKLQYDLYYIKNRSLVLDLTIAAKTLATIISRKGR